MSQHKTRLKLVNYVVTLQHYAATLTMMKVERVCCDIPKFVAIELEQENLNYVATFKNYVAT